MPERCSVADLVAVVEALPPGTCFVGIDGPGGAGKTALAARLAAAHLAQVDVVHIDDFAAPYVSEWDWDRFRRQVLLPLLAGRPARYQISAWDRDGDGAWVDVRPGGVLIVEGVSATRTEVGAPWALRVWVDTPAPVREQRALDRDGPAMWPVWRDRWIPSEQAYIARENPADRADFVVSGTS